MRYLIVVLLASIPSFTQCASESFCDTLLPFNGNISPRTAASPFDLVSSVSTAQQSEIFTIRIKSVLSGLDFTGFTVHARSTSAPSYKVLGKFKSSRAEFKLSNCNGEDNTATYYALPGSEGEVELQWEAPNDYLGEILFTATVQTDNFWVRVTSMPVEIVQADAVAAITTVISSAIRSNVSRILDELPAVKTEQRNSDPIYEGCGTTKTCLGLPTNCIEQQSCQAIATAVFTGYRYEFELKSAVDRVAYVALGLSKDDRMGEDSVMECIPSEEGITRAYSSYNNRRSNIREGVPQDIISVEDASYVNGTIYCKLVRQPVTTVQGIQFDLVNENYYFMLAIGSTVSSNGLVTRHDIARIASSEPLQIIGNQNDDSFYEGCGQNKTCFGMPMNCVDNRSCVVVVSAVAVVSAAVNETRFVFELKSLAEGVGYVSIGLSTDHLMGRDSVMECVQEPSGIRAYTSWNNPRGNTRQGVPQNIISLRNSSFVNGLLYCKLERKASSIVLDKEFDLQKEDFYFLVATGTVFAPDSILSHNRGRLASNGPLHIIGNPIDDDDDDDDDEPDDDIYEGCGDTKICFAMPPNCVTTRSCHAVVAASVHNDSRQDSRFEFELMSGVAGVGYVAFALSTDDLMGDDSVIECFPQDNITQARASWNTPGYDNNRVNVSQDIITLRSSSYIDGRIYCKVERETSTVVRGHAFDLAEEDYYFLLAIGRSVSESSVLMHDLGRISSEEPIVLTERSSAQYSAKISAISIVVWFLVTSCTYFLREKYD